MTAPTSLTAAILVIAMLVTGQAVRPATRTAPTTESDRR